MKRIEIRPACLRDASYVCANLNDLDRAEALCQMPDTAKMHELAWMLISGEGESYVAYWRGKPVAVFGVSPQHVAALSVWMLGTDQSWRAAPQIAAFIREDIGPRVAAQGFRTMEARSIETNRMAHQWMERAGGRRWTQPFEWGRNGEKFVLFRWSARDMGLTDDKNSRR